MNLKILFILSIFFGINNIYSQWQNDVRLTNDTAFSGSSINNGCAANGNTVHVVWYDLRDGNREIYYKRSTDGGINWGADTRLTNDPAVSEYPTVAVSSSVVHVVWKDARNGNWEDIYYKRSTDGGLSWETDTRLTNDPAWSWFPSVSVSGSDVHVVWQEYRDGNWEIYYKRSTDGGISWGADRGLTNNNATSWYPSVAVSGQIVHVVWQDYRDGNFEIYYKRSTNGGVSWGADTRLTFNAAASWLSTVAVSDQAVHVVWHDYRDGNYEIYYKRSTDAGISWGANTLLTNNPSGSESPSVSVSGQVVHVVWHDYRDGNYEIYYKRSTDGGISWETDTRLTNNPGDSHAPSSTVSGSMVHVVWQDNRDGNSEIYYKRDPTGKPIGIITISNEIPNQFRLLQNYPNPFNPSTTIEFDIKNTSFAKLYIYDVLGRAVETLVNEELKASSYKVAFDGGKLSSGVYYYTLTTEGFTETKKMILVK